MPVEHPALLFTILLAVILLAPLAAERLRVPGVVGLLLAGALIGPGTLGLLEREGAVALLGTLGLLYLMFVAGVELDLDDFTLNRRHSIVFGALTFAVPMAVGIPVMAALGYGALAAILLASCWASHTPLAYPVFRRHGVVRTRAVATSIGATIITDTAALLVLAGVIRAHVGQLDASFWIVLLAGVASLAAVGFWVVPRVARWFFSGLGQDRNARFLFVLLAVYGTASFAGAVGIEPIVGAFLAGLALNRLVPSGSQLMERIELLGSTLLIPLFLISVGMLVDPRLLIEPRSLGVAAAFTAVALGAKLAAAWLAGKVLRYSRHEIGAMFALSGAQAAATLAAVIVGYGAGLLDDTTVNAVIVVILVTCLVTAWTAGRSAGALPRPPSRRQLGETVVVPFVRPGSAGQLMRLAAAIARPDGGVVVPVTVVAPEAGPGGVELADRLRIEAESAALAHGVEAHGLVRIDATPSAGISHTLVERGGSLLILGWHSEATSSRTAEAIVAAGRVPMLVARLDERPVARVLVLGHPAGPGGSLATVVAQRLGRELKVGVHVADAGGLRTIAEDIRDGDLVVYRLSPGGDLRRVAERLRRLLQDVQIVMVADVPAAARPAPGSPSADALWGGG